MILDMCALPVPMDAMVALAPRLGVDAAACVALTMVHERRAAAIRLQRAARRLCALRLLERRAVVEVARLLERNLWAAPAVSKALPSLEPLPMVRRMILIRVMVVGGW